MADRRPRPRPRRRCRQCRLLDEDRVNRTPKPGTLRPFSARGSHSSPRPHSNLRDRGLGPALAARPSECPPVTRGTRRLRRRARPTTCSPARHRRSSVTSPAIRRWSPTERRLEARRGTRPPASSWGAPPGRSTLRPRQTDAPVRLPAAGGRERQLQGAGVADGRARQLHVDRAGGQRRRPAGPRPADPDDEDRAGHGALPAHRRGGRRQRVLDHRVRRVLRGAHALPARAQDHRSADGGRGQAQER